MIDCEDSLTIVNASDEIARAIGWLERFAGRAAVPADIASKLQVALDEIVSNVFNHAFAGAAAGARRVGLGVRRRAGLVELEVSDDGPEFNPMAVVPESAAARIAARRAGGVGLLFVKEVMDDVRFVRAGGRNTLIVAMRLPSAS